MSASIAQVLVELVIALHFAFVVFVLLGGLLVLRHPRWAWLHMPCAIYGMLIEFVGWVCPLTPLEHWLRRQAGLETYEGGFLQHHLEPLIYPGWLDRRAQLLLGSIVLAMNVLIYLIAFRRRRNQVGRDGR